MWNTLKARFFPTATRTLDIRSWHTLDDYRAFRESSPQMYQHRYQQQVALIQHGKFTVEGYCYVCQAPATFAVNSKYADGRLFEGKPMPNWREQLKCTGCGNINRIRAMLQFLQENTGVKPSAQIYIAEQLTPLYTLMRSQFTNLTGSEYLGTKVPLGQIDPESGLRNENLTQLSFADNSLDAIVTCDVFEHIPDILSALHECSRCLKHGEILVFSIPFNLPAQQSELRARVNAQGEIEHLKEPQYHGDPLSDQGCLCFHDFGWDLLDMLKTAGFTDASMHTYWSRELCYLGTENLLFSARK